VAIIACWVFGLNFVEDYTASLINYTVTVSGQPNQLTLSMFGWISFMRRQTGSKDGNWAVPWVSYVNGFGFSETFLWLGLERIYQLTSNGNWRMRMEYYFNNLWVSAEYWTFTLSSNSSNYAIDLTG
jgi:Fibrinogen beta and gamma chains, C-terminal globular domain